MNHRLVNVFQMKNNVVNYTEDDYQKNRHPEFFKSNKLSQAWSVYAYLEYLKKARNKDILEFGGALGYNLLEAVKYNRVVMIEPSPIGRKIAQTSGIVTYCDIQEMNTDKEHLFDVILCRHVLEHVHNPLIVLENFKSLLKPEGTLILILPCEKQLKPVKNEIDFHLYCWTPRTANNLLCSAGFNNTKWKYNYFTGKRLYYLVYQILGGKAYYWCIKLTGKIFNAKEMVFITQ